MEHPRGRIISVQHSELPPYALVEVDTMVQCARCAAGKGCGAGLLGGTTGSRRVEALIGAGLTVSEGDEVRIELEPRNLLQASLIVYGVPLVSAIVAAALAYSADLGDLDAALAALGGIVAGLLFVRFRLRKANCLRQFTPTVIERIAVQRGRVGS
ncbi:MAG: SoxR reducing system RseC family protein [Woeseiaceae bacterium]